MPISTSTVPWKTPPGGRAATVSPGGVVASPLWLPGWTAKIAPTVLATRAARPTIQNIESGRLVLRFMGHSYERTFRGLPGIQQASVLQVKDLIGIGHDAGIVSDDQDGGALLVGGGAEKLDDLLAVGPVEGAGGL